MSKATKSDEKKLDRAGPSGEPLQQKLIDSKTGEIMENEEDILYGIKTSEGFRAIDKNYLAQIKEKTKLDCIDIVEFVPYQEVPFERVTGAYYLQSQHKGNPKAMRHFVEALLMEDVAATGKWTARSRQKEVVIYPSNNGVLLMNTISFANEWKSPDEEVMAHMKYDLDQDILQSAAKLIRAKTGTDTIDTLEDEAIILTLDLVAKALEGKPIDDEGLVVSDTSPDADLMKALEKSIKESKRKVKA